MTKQAVLEKGADLSAATVAAHVEMLEERVFQVKTRWPHFRRLLEDLKRFADELPTGATVVSLERTLLYGGVSLVAPLFHRQNFVSVDCSPAVADERGAYNAGMIDDPRTIRISYSKRGTEIETGLPDGIADLVLVPNLVHHVADHDRLFGEMARITRADGRVYVFEPLLREMHQMPEDYLRFTPFGLNRAMKMAGLENESIALEGGPFSAIAYCWDQALQYFPEPKRQDMTRWFFEEQFPQLLSWDDEYRNNLVRGHTCFPVAFSVMARKI
jgi:SAM-dependent methyltransferase